MFIAGSPTFERSDSSMSLQRAPADHTRRGLRHVVKIAAWRRLTWVVACASIALVACQHRTPQPPSAPASEFPPGFPAQFYSSQPADTVYRIVASRSSINIKVYRAGALAALGHNHVITASTDGFIYLADDLANARADLFVPV